MKSATALSAMLFLLTTACLTGCASSHQDSAQARLASNAERQQADAERLGKEYLECIDHILGSSSVDVYASNNTRQEMVMASCHENLEPFTIVQEQAYNNACLAAGKDSKGCDNDAVSKTARDASKLQQEARKEIDHASPQRHHP